VKVRLKMLLRRRGMLCFIEQLQQPLHFRLHAAKRSGINFRASASDMGL
jgi:hypothetical protein